MKRSGGPTADEGSSLTFTRQKRMLFGNQTLKKIQRAGISAQRGSWTVRCRMLAAYHMASQRLTLAYIFMCEYVLTKSASLYLPSHSCIWKLLRVKGFSEVGPCPPAPRSSHWLKRDRKVFGPQKQLTESVPHVLPTALFTELSRNTMEKKKHQVLNLVYFGQIRMLAWVLVFADKSAVRDPWGKIQEASLIEGEVYRIPSAYGTLINALSFVPAGLQRIIKENTKKRRHHWVSATVFY